MKISLYDNIMDRIFNLIMSIICIAVSLGVSYLVMYVISQGLSSFIDYNLSNWIYHLVPWGFSTPFTFLVWASATAHKKHDISLRDFWAKFSTFVDFKMDESYGYEKSEEVRKEQERWLLKNCSSLYRKVGSSDGVDTYVFLSSADAVAFKLKWT